MFSEPSSESAMCIAIAFYASLRHISLLIELKAQFNHDGVISRFGSLLSMRHSSISLNRFMASFNIWLLYSLLALMFASFFYSSGSFIMIDTFLVTSIDTHWWNCSLRCSSNFFLTTLASKTPFQWSSTKNRSIASLYFPFCLVHWPLSKFSWLSKTHMLASKVCTSSVLANFFNFLLSNAFNSSISPFNCSMQLQRLLILPSNPCIIRLFERWRSWNSLYCDCRNLYSQSKSSTITPSQSLADSSSYSSPSWSIIIVLICMVQFLESATCTYLPLASMPQPTMLGSIVMTSSSTLILVVGSSSVISNTKRLGMSCLGVVPFNSKLLQVGLVNVEPLARAILPHRLACNPTLENLAVITNLNLQDYHIVHL